MEMSIGELSRLSGVPASTIRYYEEICVLARPRRTRGRRAFQEADLDRLLVVAFAKEAGLSLREIRRLFDGFASETSAGARWKTLAESKLAELDELTVKIEAMRKLLKDALRCGCIELESCGRLLRGMALSGRETRLPPSRARAERAAVSRLRRARRRP
jgi:DNA-binding transcriptional MerR regulator